MTATLITPSRHETVVEFTRYFEWSDCPGAGFSFDVDEHGTPGLGSEAARANWEMCLSGKSPEGIAIHDRGLQRSERTVFVPAEYQCECGHEFSVDGDCQCVCGRWHNPVGQELDAHAMECPLYAQGIDCMCHDTAEYDIALHTH